MRRVRTFRRFGGVLLGVGGLLIIAGELAFARVVLSMRYSPPMWEAVLLVLWASSRWWAPRCVGVAFRSTSGSASPCPSAAAVVIIGGGVLLGLAGVVAGATVLAVTNDSGCGDGSDVKDPSPS